MLLVIHRQKDSPGEEAGEEGRSYTLGLSTDPPAVIYGAVVGDSLRVVGSLAFLSAEMQRAAADSERGEADDTQFTAAVSATSLHYESSLPRALVHYMSTEENPFEVSPLVNASSYWNEPNQSRFYQYGLVPTARPC